MINNLRAEPIKGHWVALTMLAFMMLGLVMFGQHGTRTILSQIGV